MADIARAATTPATAATAAAAQWTRAHTIRRRWIAEPELVIPPVAGSELLSVCEDTDKSAIDDGVVWQRVYRRRLLPKRPDKDAPLVEHVRLCVLRSPSNGRSMGRRWPL
ncbi:hypothetical protein SYNPS1DRAFT_31349 [Syncephalis pseudoplumigaleata]|uniref:Uncharacterized protein n=1 Tax=Syncephalis pseudoplumigaleata TaxID=1712513 RepID=A0A4P9YU84_9FUNG|nr:hypothetical protein SYNPS1DRAFT_31349 [Syncephalis pseudoplumigaleata]|eukprot:RKP22962.1 hypothetical protein SYNPS1DRAFT_31349 [Syncephalis pseudoplumigaleata]